MKYLASYVLIPTKEEAESDTFTLAFLNAIKGNNQDIPLIAPPKLFKYTPVTKQHSTTFHAIEITGIPRFRTFMHYL